MMSKSKIRFIVAFVIFALICTFFIHILSSGFSEVVGGMDKRDKEMKSHVGETVIIDKDTLTIIDYSFMDNNYTLGNGLKVSEAFLQNQNKDERRRN
jgi:hypothetical protein|tara:strand:+ start:28 stop:318 length:291 start_codon:yes stop_codon:yes gene_type:complete